MREDVRNERKCKKCKKCEKCLRGQVRKCEKMREDARSTLVNSREICIAWFFLHLCASCLCTSKPQYLCTTAPQHHSTSEPLHSALLNTCCTSAQVLLPNPLYLSTSPLCTSPLCTSAHVHLHDLCTSSADLQHFSYAPLLHLFTSAALSLFTSAPITYLFLFL